MAQPYTVIPLIILTALAFAAAVDAVLRVVLPRLSKSQSLMQQPLTGLIALGSTILFIYRWVGVNGFVPVLAHVDGLILIAALLAASLFYLDFRSRMRSLSAFGLPALFIFLLWAICAVTFTFHPFGITHGTLIMSAHRVGVYVGSLFLVLAAAAGAMYLLIQHRLRKKNADFDTHELPSLETTETFIIRSSAVGFALLTVGLITGVIILLIDEHLHSGWWYSTKVILAVSVWLIYGLVTNVRHTTSFRGARAAWLAIIGIVLLFAVYGVVTGTGGKNVSPEPASDHQRDDSGTTSTKSTAATMVSTQEAQRCTS